jgi:hypothetical protein
MAAFLAAVSHFCNNSTRGALPRVVVNAQPHLFLRQRPFHDCCESFIKMQPDIETNCQEVLYFLVIEQKRCCTA